MQKINAGFDKTTLFVDEVRVRTLFLDPIANIMQEKCENLISCWSLCGEMDIRTRIYATMGFTVGIPKMVWFSPPSSLLDRNGFYLNGIDCGIVILTFWIAIGHTVDLFNL